MEYDVVVWRDELSDGSTCYAAVCPAINYAHGQGDTEAEALTEAAATMAGFLERMPGVAKSGQAAQDELTEKLADLASEGIAYWVRQVAPAASPTLA